MSEKKEQPKILNYKGKPLVRNGNVICYGDVKSDKYILILEIKQTKMENDREIATKVLVLIKSMEEDAFVKYTEKDSLYEAFELGEIWIDGFLREG